MPLWKRCSKSNLQYQQQPLSVVPEARTAPVPPAAPSQVDGRTIPRGSPEAPAPHFLETPPLALEKEDPLQQGPQQGRLCTPPVADCVTRVLSTSASCLSVQAINHSTFPLVAETVQAERGSGQCWEEEGVLGFSVSPVPRVGFLLLSAPVPVFLAV